MANIMEKTSQSNIFLYLFSIFFGVKGMVNIWLILVNILDLLLR